MPPPPGSVDLGGHTGLADIEDLPVTNGVFSLRGKFFSSIDADLLPPRVPGSHQVRSAFAGKMKQLDADFESEAASG